MTKNDLAVLRSDTVAHVVKRSVEEPKGHETPQGVATAAGAAVDFLFSQGNLVMKIEKSKAAPEIDVPNAALCLVSQGDLRAVQYQLYLLGEDETDPEKKQAFKNVEDALWEITNHSGVDGIASLELMQQYFPEKVPA